MEFRILGPVEVRRDGQALALGGSKRRALLALLVLHANEAVSGDRLADDLWGEHLPHNAAAALHNHVYRLRKLLGAHVLVTRPGGYSLVVDPSAIDLHRFEQLVAEAETGDPIARAALLHEALELWRGPALADLLHEPFAAAEANRLEESRLAALERRIDADLALARHAELVGELERLVGEHPLRERLRGQLILALYRAGRQAEALEVYRETRRVLADELGLEPSPALRELEQAILRQDPVLAPAPESPPLRGSRKRVVLAAILAGLLAGGAAAGFATSRTGDPKQLAARPRLATASALSTSKAAPVREPVTTSRRPVRKPHRTTHALRGPLRRAPTTHATIPPRRVTKPASAPRRPAPHAGTTTAAPSPAPQKGFRLRDDFGDGVLNSLIWWTGSFGTGTELVERNGRLEMMIAADATGSSEHWIMGQYGTKCWFAGEFDARVQYTLVDWPAANGVAAILQAYLGQIGSAQSSRSSNAWGEQYSSWMPSRSRNLPTGDAAGALRVARTKGVITTYYRAKGRWIELDTSRSSVAVFIGLQIFASSESFAGKEVRVAFDNFVVEATDASCT
ncbi:MAG TPA: BTAD domain-containing putative transcriptional regulator [Gaiellaceae bacterium]|nr:BTAD domain-containing putative transcriptional regulator [Gaiellaceae bacterium]